MNTAKATRKTVRATKRPTVYATKKKATATKKSNS